MRVLTAAAIAFTMLSAPAFGNNEDHFWKWFVANEQRLFTFETNREAVFDELGKELGRVNSDLTFEFGPIKNGRREFVISAGGIKAAFPAVEALYAKAPSLPRWVWVKFRPRRDPINDLTFGDKEVKADDVRYILVKDRDKDKVGIVLFFDGYRTEERSTYGQIGYLLLDEALGEYATETQVGFVDFNSRESKYFSQSHPLRELPDHFDEYWRHHAH